MVSLDTSICRSLNNKNVEIATYFQKQIKLRSVHFAILLHRSEFLILSNQL